MQQAQALAQQINAEGYQASTLPLLEIQPIELSSPFYAANTLIFVSANAAIFGLNQIEAAAVDLANTRLLAIGPATQTEIAKHGFVADAAESGFRSEELLDKLKSEGQVSPEFSLVCGEGGREFLEQGLREMGAQVNRLEVYRRISAEGVDSGLKELNQRDLPDLISLMNEESLNIFENAICRLGLEGWKNIPVVVSSSRIEKTAKDLGFIQVFCQTDPTESALIEFLTQFSN